MLKRLMMAPSQANIALGGLKSAMTSAKPLTSCLWQTQQSRNMFMR